MHCSCCCCHFCQPLPASISGILEQSSEAGAGAAAKGEAEAIYAPPELVFVLSLSWRVWHAVASVKYQGHCSHLTGTPQLHTSLAHLYPYPSVVSSLLSHSDIPFRSLFFIHSVRREKLAHKISISAILFATIWQHFCVAFSPCHSPLPLSHVHNSFPAFGLAWR